MFNNLIIYKRTLFISREFERISLKVKGAFVNNRVAVAAPFRIYEYLSIDEKKEVVEKLKEDLKKMEQEIKIPFQVIEELEEEIKNN